MLQRKRLGIALVCCAVGVQAQDGAEAMLERSTFELQAGGFLSDFDTLLRLSGPNGGTELDLESSLGLDTKDATFRGLAAWRFGERHRLSLGYYDFSRSAQASADNSFVIDTEDGLLEFEAGAAIRGSFDWTLVPLIYSYSFHQSRRFEAAVDVGVHWAEARFSIAGEATVNGQPVAEALETESSSAPLPVLGLHAAWAATDRIRIGTRLNYFGLAYNDISGDLFDIRLTSEYLWTDSFSLGLGYTWYNINYQDVDGPYRFDLDYDYDGLEAFIGWRF